MLSRILIIAFLVVGCVAELAPVTEFEVDLERLSQQTTPLDSTQRRLMNGVYEVVQGQDLLGSVVSGRWVGSRWCLYAQHDVVLAECAGGFAADTVLSTGFVRVVRSGSGTHLDLSILPADGGSDLLEGRSGEALVIRGTTSNGVHLELRRIRDHYQPIAPFHVLAHRGGGRNSERLGLSENSIAMVRRAARMGATGVEIDVRSTRDHHLIVFHDETFSPRTVSGAYLLGRVDAFDLDQIERYGQLINGEPIPTLDEMLRVIVDSTQLQLVWIDAKNAADVAEIIRVQRDALMHAMAVNRDVLIAIGMPTSDVVAAVIAATSGTTPTPSISELGLEATLADRERTGCVAWAPRWTTEITPHDISRAHALELLVFTWTLDVRDYIADYLYNKQLDGILTNYPSLVAGMQDTRSGP